MWQQVIEQLIRDEFARRSKKNPLYSARSFARLLKISPATLSLILNKKADWTLSKARAQIILNELKLSPSKTRKLQMLLKSEIEPHLKSILEEDYPLLTDWTYFPTLLCFDLTGVQLTAAQIAERLGISTQKVKDNIQDQLKRKMLKKVDGKIYRNADFLSSSDGTTSDYIKRYHENQLELTRRALQEIDTAERQISAVTFVASKKDLEVMRREIKSFYAKVLGSCQSDELDELYQLNVQLYPVRFSSKKGTQK